MSKQDRYAEREWITGPRERPAFEPYGAALPASPIDTIECPADLYKAVVEDMERVVELPLPAHVPTVERITLHTRGTWNVVETHEAPATPAEMEAFGRAR